MAGKSVLVHVLVHANLPPLREKEIRVYEYVYEYGLEKPSQRGFRPVCPFSDGV